MKKNFLKAVAALSAAVMLLSGCGNDAQTSGDNVENGTADAAKGKTFADPTDGFIGNTGDVTLDAGDTYALISVENFGDIKIKLYPEAAPYGVQNFIDLAESGYFTGKNIHRIISGFMLQGGSLNGNGTGGTSADGDGFYCEINSKMRHFYGALCYANANGWNTCQFYIVNNTEPQTVNDEYYETMQTAYREYRDMFIENRNNYDENSYEYAYFDSQVQSFDISIEGWEFIKGKDADGKAAAKYAEVGGTPSLDGAYTVFGQTVEGFDVIDAISAVETDGNDAPLEEILISSITIHTA